MIRRVTCTMRTYAGLLGWILTLAVGFLFVSYPATRPTLAVFAILSALWFVLRYQTRTKGHWRDTVHGRHVMTFSLACVIILTYACLNLLGLIPAWLVPYLGVLTYATLGWLFLWRNAILTKSQREPKE
jgi:hypothetical protein